MKDRLTGADLPRVIVAGLAGDTGKSLVSLGITRAMRARGLRVAPFKKGPDFIDAAWLGAAAGQPCRNLDTFLMPEAAISASLASAGQGADLAIVEGNRGLFDGMDADGSHSTAHLAKLTGCPLILVVDATKVTRTVAAQVLGCQALDPELNLLGVILNRVATSRQEKVIRDALMRTTGLPVLGVIPKLRLQHLPSRHLGLVTAAEHPDAEAAIEAVAQAAEQHVNLDAVLTVARAAQPLSAEARQPSPSRSEARPRIGVLTDRAFSFYYPENLQALEQAGAELVPFSPLEDSELPDMDGLYAGGGFPEVHAAELSANSGLRSALSRRIDEGLPVWAECGGLMYLSRAVIQDDVEHPMVGALPVVVEQQQRPQGHGYVQARVDRDNAFLPCDLELRGHEFHYSRLQQGQEPLDTVLAIERGVGVGQGRDGLRRGSVVATYTHVHALGTPEWAPGLVRAAAGGAA